MFKSPVELVLLVATVVGVTLVTLRLTDKEATSLTQPIVNVLPAPMATRGGDDRYTMAPRPQRVWDNGPEIPVRGAMDPLAGLATRGAPEAYQQMGVILGGDGKPLPLYGRRTAPRSDRFNYYTRTDSYNPVALPLIFKKRDCQDGVGCDEVMSGDELRIGATGDTAKVTLYGFDGPRYVG